MFKRQERQMPHIPTGLKLVQAAINSAAFCLDLIRLIRKPPRASASNTCRKRIYWRLLTFLISNCNTYFEVDALKHSSTQVAVRLFGWRYPNVTDFHSTCVKTFIHYGRFDHYYGCYPNLLLKLSVFLPTYELAVQCILTFHPDALSSSL